MPIELTDQQQKYVREQEGAPVEVVDPQTHRSYVLLGHEAYEKVQALLERTAEPTPAREIPEGIRRCQEAMRKVLPELIANPRYYRQWVAYHGEERIGIAGEKTTLIRECLRRGLRDDEYYVGWIDHCELVEEEEIDFRPWHMADPEDSRPTSDTP